MLHSRLIPFLRGDGRGVFAGRLRGLRMGAGVVSAGGGGAARDIPRVGSGLSSNYEPYTKDINRTIDTINSDTLRTLMGVVGTWRFVHLTTAALVPLQRHHPPNPNNIDIAHSASDDGIHFDAKSGVADKIASRVAEEINNMNHRCGP